MSKFSNLIKSSLKIKKKLLIIEKKVDSAVNIMTDTIVNGGKVMICGNGGSAADAQHLAAEFIIRLRPKVNRKAIPVLSLAMETSSLTACGNDFSFADIFVRPFNAFANSKDLLITISTSGNSKNIIKVLKSAKKKNVKCISLLGAGGGKAKDMADLDIIVPSKITARIQECHIMLGHYIFEQTENNLLRKKLI
jgi:D-sedoheptulose 7-phosphate isomerase